MSPRSLAAASTLDPVPQPLEAEWERLVARSGATPFHSLGWLRAWWSAFGRGRLMLVTLRDGSELVAGVPLQVSGRRLSSPTNWHTPVFGPVADSADSARQLLDYVFGLEHRSIDLSWLATDDQTLELAIASARGAGRLVSARRLARSPWIDLTGGWDDCERRLSRNRLKSVRRSRRRLEELGGVSLDVVEGGPGLERALEEAFRIETSGWKGSRGTAMVSRPETRRFYSEVARWAAGRGWLRLSFLRLDDNAAAFDLSLEHDGVRYSLKAGYQAELARSGPGVTLLHELLLESHREGVRRFELLPPEDEFKRSWTEHAGDRAWMRACAPSVAGRAEALFLRARERVRPAARRVRARIAS